MHRVIFMLVFLLAVRAEAQSYPAKAAVGAEAKPALAACPWLTEGSAAAALGGSVRATVSITSDNQGSCTFTKKDAPMGQLKIVVGSTNVAVCPAGSERVVGVGTQANRCRLQATHDAGGAEMISGKVRGVNMAVTVSRAGAASTGSEYREPVGIEEIAEQVAGSLF